MTRYLDGLLTDTAREIARLSHLQEVAGKVADFAANLEVMGLTVRVDYFGGGAFMVDILAGRAREPEPGVPAFLRPVGEVVEVQPAPVVEVEAAPEDPEPMAAVAPEEPIGFPAGAEQNDALVSVAAAPGLSSGAPWSEAEIDTALALLGEGASVTVIAEAVGRPFEATKKKLQRLKAEPDRVREPEPKAIEEVAPDPEPFMSPAASAASIESAPPDDPAAAHAAGLPRGDGWTIARDMDLLQLSMDRWPAHEIALQIEVPSGELKPRLKLLTGGGRFTWTEMLRHLTSLAAAA